MPRTVLLADDSVTAQNMGRRILTDAGYEVITVNNGSAALKKIHEVRPDLIVLDVYMPGYGGLEVCQRLKESGDTMKIPVLLTVGKMEPFKPDEAKRVRADAHIVKPFEASELLAALAKLEDRIVPEESSRGRKSKKPSFWHEEESKAPRDWSDNAEYLAQVKQRKGGNTEDVPVPEPAPEVPAEVKSSNIGAFPLVHEATGELPVVPDSTTVPSDEQSAPVAADPETISEEKLQEPAPTLKAEVPAAEPPIAEKQSEINIPEETGKSAAPRWIAENVAVSPEEAALELEQEMRAAEAAETVQSAPPKAGDTPVATLEAASTERQGATFAAAAGASSGGSVSAVASATEESEPQVGSEAAAAWQNWQQIRDTVMNTQATEALAESVAQAAKTAPAEEIAAPTEAASGPDPESVSVAASSSAPSSVEQAPAPNAEPSELDGALASIVDSVLAELKPKLMQEISKKLKK